MNKVAIVTGASRGLGRGIALTLAKEEGYIVYATARNKKALEDLAAEATVDNSTGGVIHACALDQKDDAAVEAFVGRVAAEQKTIKLLVNSAYSGLIAIAPHFGKSFWERPLSVYDEAFDVGVRSSYVMSKFVAPLMVAQQQGLIIQTSSTGAFHYAFDVAYGAAHSAMDRLTADMALELKDHKVNAITLHPVGGCQTEVVSFPGGESVIYVGRAVAALAEKATEAELTQMSGQVVITGELSEKYNFSDDNDPQGEAKKAKIEEAKGQRSMMEQVQFQNQQQRTLDVYDTDNGLPFKFTDLNSPMFGEMFSGAKDFS